MHRFNRTAFEAQETRFTEEVSRKLALEKQFTQPIETKRRRHWWLSGLALLLVCLLVLGAFSAQALIRGWFAPAAAPQTSQLQHILHPDTSTLSSSSFNSAVDLFMGAMLQKNWESMWSQLAPDAQRTWKDKQDFTHFEQAKFGALNLQSYSMGQGVTSQPWLDPDTTRVYSSAATVSVTLQASAPAGLLTAPSNQALSQGLFNSTLFALIPAGQQNWKVLIAGPADLDAPVLVPSKPPVSHLIIPIFMYHHISSVPTKDLFDFNLTVKTADFNAQLDWLQQQGYHTITMTELFATFYYGKALPAKPVILTFDDGYTDVYTDALPALLTHHYRGVFYIITGMIGGHYVTWNEVRTLARSGMQIASHTIHHVNIGRPPAGMTTQSELEDSKTKLESELHEPIQFFCYPTGEPFHHDTLAERQIVLNDLFTDGYLGATLDPSAFDSALQNSQIPYQLPRIRVSGGERLDAFIGILATTEREDQLRLQRLGKAT
jgi:peptidoglycan/xylan/chitin deacetylase (PgdA/CDA1 family)